MNSPTTKEKLVNVTLLTDGHTHAGIARAKGDRIDVTPAEAAWLTEPKRGPIAAVTKPGTSGSNEA